MKGAAQSLTGCRCSAQQAGQQITASDEVPVGIAGFIALGVVIAQQVAIGIPNFMPGAAGFCDAAQQIAISIAQFMGFRHDGFLFSQANHSSQLWQMGVAKSQAPVQWMPVGKPRG